MNSTLYSVIILLLLTCGVLLLTRSANKNRNAESGYAENQPEILSKEEGEDHLSVLMNSITPVWYWRVNHEYIDFIHSTIKRMTMAELNETSGLFDAQRRCSDLNSAVYKYYDNIKERCLSGEKVPCADLDVLNLRQCFKEFSLEAYPALVALVWPEYQHPEIKAEEVRGAGWPVLRAGEADAATRHGITYDYLSDEAYHRFGLPSTTCLSICVSSSALDVRFASA